VDGLDYTTEVIYHCPLRVLRERIAHCYDGAVFAAAALRRIGEPPLVLNLTAFDRDHWMTQDEALDRIADRLEAMRRIPFLTPAMIAGLSPVDDRTYRAGLLGANPAGLFLPAGVKLATVRARLATWTR